MADLIRVGMADYKVGSAPSTIISYGLGSCIGISLYDPQTKVGGLLHIMLPDSTQARPTDNPAKFADTGIVELVRQMEQMGAKKSRMVAKIAGGAAMFASARSDIVQVGQRNVEATEEALRKLQIPIIAKDTGANYGRTVIFYPDTGQYHIRAVGKSETII